MREALQSVVDLLGQGFIDMVTVSKYPLIDCPPDRQLYSIDYERLDERPKDSRTNRWAIDFLRQVIDWLITDQIIGIMLSEVSSDPGRTRYQIAFAVKNAPEVTP